MLKADTEILEALGLAGASDLLKAQRIIKRNAWDELVEGRRIHVYFRPSRRVNNELLTEQVLQVDCHVPSKEDYLAYRLQARIKTLLHEAVINGRRLYFNGMLGDLPTVSGYTCVGSRYRYYATI